MSRITVSLALSLSLLACGEAPPKDNPARPVKTETVRGTAAAAGLRYAANIEPYEQVSLAFKVSGYVREIQQRPGSDGRPRDLQQGDHVRKGDVLARVQEADYEERARTARAQQAEAQAGLTKARLDYERAERLYQSQSLTRPDYDSAKASLDMYQARLESAAAQLASAEISLRDTALVAPMSGIVLHKYLEAGALASPGAPAFVLADIRRVKVVFGAPDRVAQELQTGMTIPFTAETLGPEGFEGRITAIAPSADTQSRVFSIELTVENQDGRLKPGMIAAVELPGGRESDASLTIPIAAVVESPDTEGYAVFVVDEAEGKTSVRLRTVTLGPITGNRIAVSSGLAPDARVVVTGATLLVDGEAVRVIP
jgi:multidrug efflux system membrane fusion protein